MINTLSLRIRYTPKGISFHNLDKARHSSVPLDTLQHSRELNHSSPSQLECARVKIIEIMISISTLEIEKSYPYLILIHLFLVHLYPHRVFRSKFAPPG